MSCPNCFTGHVHSGTPTGKEIDDVHGLKAYVAEPVLEVAARSSASAVQSEADGDGDGDSSRDRNVKGLIVVVPDAVGWGMVNARLVADGYAKRTGCRVFLVDFMGGTACPGWMMPVMGKLMGQKKDLWDYITMPWLVLQALYGVVPFVLRNRLSTKLPQVKKFFDDFRCDEGDSLPVGAVGFCWGGYMVTQLAHGDVAKSGKPLVDAVFTAHPSFLGIPGDIEKIKKPYSVAVGDMDVALPVQGARQMQDVLDEKKKKDEVDSEVVVIPGAEHGFAVRGNPDNAMEKEHADLAEDQCVKWFAKYLV